MVAAEAGVGTTGAGCLLLALNGTRGRGDTAGRGDNAATTTDTRLRSSLHE